MNADVRKSPPPRPCGDAAAFPPFVIPTDTPAYARKVLTSLDAAIAGEAGQPPANLSSGVAGAPIQGTAAAAIPASAMSRDARLTLAGRMHARAGGALAFFLFHYLRLLAEQAEARQAGVPCPAQTWAMPDWCPTPPDGIGRLAFLHPERPSPTSSDAASSPAKDRHPRPDCGRVAETSLAPARYGAMGIEDVPAHLQPRVERLVQNAKAELEARGIDTTGKLPRQILRMAQIERHKPGLERGRQKRLNRRGG